MADNPRARNNARFREYQRKREQARQQPDHDYTSNPAYIALPITDRHGNAFQQAREIIERQITQSCLNPALVTTTEGQPVNTSRALRALQRHAAATEGHQDAKGARRTRAGTKSDFVDSRAINTPTLGGRSICGSGGVKCGRCHHCQLAAVDAKDAASHPTEASALLTDETKLKKKQPEKVRGFTI